MSFFDDMLDDNVRKGLKWHRALPKFAVVLRKYHNIVAYHVIKPKVRSPLTGQLCGPQIGPGHGSVRAALDWLVEYTP